MSIPLLATKLYLPARRPDQIRRTRLHDVLTGGVHRKLTLVSAPAGFGKTTLVAGWIAALGAIAAEDPPTRCAWISLDERDGEPTRFVTYAVAALETVVPEIGSGLTAVLEAPHPPFESILTTLLNRIGRVADKIVLVLDDVHLAGSPAVYDCLGFLLDHLPPQLHLVFTTREDPPLPLSRYRARGHLTELRADDLRFTPEEAAEFLRQTMGPALDAAEISALEARTEGWIAGLQLAALSLQGQTDIAGFLAAFTGSHRFVLDYLMDEVLAHQNESVRTFLLQTSILDRLCGSLCDAVCERRDGQQMLETLERDNLFVVPQDGERRWYRYHHLFAEVLLVHLSREESDQLPDLHRRASEWYAQNQLPVDAIHHALAAEDFARAARIIELAWPPIYNGLSPAAWLAWVQALPDAIVHARPVLSVGYAWTLLDCGQVEEVDDHLNRAQQWVDQAASGAPADPPMIVVNQAEFQSLGSTIAMGRAYLARALGDEEATARYARQALEILPPEGHYWRGIAAMFLGLAHQTSGELDTAYQYFAGSVASLHKAGHLHFQLVGTVALADIRVAQGRLHDAVRTYQRALHFTAAKGEAVRHEQAILLVGLAEILHEQGHPAQAEEHLRQAEELAEDAWSQAAGLRLDTAKARIKASRGEYDEALELLAHAEQGADHAQRSALRPLAAWRTRILLRRGRMAEALAWVRDRGLSDGDPCSYRTEFEQLTLARVRLAEFQHGRADAALHEATDLLARLLHAAEAGGRTGSIIELLVAQALASHAAEDHAAAAQTLMRALALAQPQGYVRVFADEGRAMHTLLTDCLTRGADPVYIARLIGALPQPAGGELRAPDANQLLVEPLSNRELDVLRLLNAGYTNQAVADELVIAVSTVKKHVNNLFGKLGVSNRTQAVARARELDLL